MSDTKLQAARQLIQEKNYIAARSILQTMPDNVTAVKWLAKLNEISPPSPPIVQQQRDTKGWVFVIISAIVLLAVIGAIVFSVYQQSEGNQRAAKEWACGLSYSRYSTQWQNCVDDH